METVFIPEDLTANLPSLSFEAPLTADGKKITKALRDQRRWLSCCGCGHAVFYCNLLTAMRCKLLNESFFLHSLLVKFEMMLIHKGSLRVGIVGCGQFGNQLVMSLLLLTDLTPHDIFISTRRPEKLDDLQALGVQCFYDNRRVAGSVDLLFLCCLPCHLLKVATEIRGNVHPFCVVYSLVTGVSILRLKQVLEHSAVLKPEYCVQDMAEHADLWQANRSTAEALQEPRVIEATSPFKPSGVWCVNSKWFEAVLYSTLNIFHPPKVPSQVVLDILNDLFFGCSEPEAGANTPLFTWESFVNQPCASMMTEEDPFPWFDLTTVAVADTPLTEFLAAQPSLWEHLAHVYQKAMSDTEPVAAPVNNI
uniref:NADP-dependent oxidoreductase domain-containing protein 1 n=1 Tax=Callorhinchus milii TaxID=7868 RepID=A0A4W3HER1_CALMI|eukprot:gi/632983042/ref/XP_007908452.1/ PREDICTED: NADP-dependent oxidoreductase domain-containing protein 1 [Callorhinchus milii]